MKVGVIMPFHILSQNVRAQIVFLCYHPSFLYSKPQNLTFQNTSHCRNVIRSKNSVFAESVGISEADHFDHYLSWLERVQGEAENKLLGVSRCVMEMASWGPHVAPCPLSLHPLLFSPFWLTCMQQLCSLLPS